MRRYIAVFVVICAFMMLFLSAAYSEDRSVTVKGKKGTDTSASVNARYHALIIGSNNYKHLPKLKTAIADAKAVEEILRTKYGFKTKLLIDATRADILGNINKMRKKLGSNDNLLIYYAGHGEFDKNVEKAYWLPVDAQRDDPTNWIIADDITSNIKRISSRHILLVSDSCYSGTLTRAAVIDLKSAEKDEYIKKMAERPSRTLMASGGNEPVADGGGSGHSVFASAFLKALKETEKNVFTAEELFHGRGSVKEMVAGKSDQVPEYNTIKNSGHEGGDFVFQTAKASVSGAGGYTAPLAPIEIKEPSGKDFKIDDLEKEAKEIEKNKAAWNSKLQKMKQAYGKVKTFEKGTSPADRKSSAWQRFLDTFSQDNPYSQEDDTMRQEAEERVSYWNSQQQIAMAPRPDPSVSPLGKGGIKGGVFKDPLTNIEFVFVKGGCYGSSYTVHEVCVDDFYIGKYEVTQGQWKAVMGNNPSSFSSCGDNCPVEQVSWNDIQDFINKLNQKNNPPSPPFSKGGLKDSPLTKGAGGLYRLPTEAEWEYAARSGGKSEKYAGTSNESELGDYAWYDKNSGSKRHPVGQKKPNGLGIYDMTGNVWEWVNDWYDSDYYKNSPKSNPTGPSSGKEYKVLRGGSWFFDAWLLETSYRFWIVPTFRFYFNGFRLAFPAK